MRMHENKFRECENTNTCTAYIRIYDTIERRKKERCTYKSRAPIKSVIWLFFQFENKKITRQPSHNNNYHRIVEWKGFELAKIRWHCAQTNHPILFLVDFLRSTLEKLIQNLRRRRRQVNIYSSICACKFGLKFYLLPLKVLHTKTLHSADFYPIRRWDNNKQIKKNIPLICYCAFACS